MIRISLSTHDLEHIQIAQHPDFGYELALGIGALAYRTTDRRLARWRQDATTGWHHTHNRLLELYTPHYIPAFFTPITQPHPTPIDPTTPPATAHLRDLARTRALTPFTRALTDAHPTAITTLTTTLTTLRTRAIDPYRRRITSQIATAATTAHLHHTLSGTPTMLNTLHPHIHYTGRELHLATRTHATEPLNGRPLILQPTALATTLIFDPHPDHITILYPATTHPLTPDPHLHTPPPALTALLGATRAAALTTLVKTPAITTTHLATTLGVSTAAASRHTTALRNAGLIATIRHRQTVHHAPTPLGTNLVHTTTHEQPA